MIRDLVRDRRRLPVLAVLATIAIGGPVLVATTGGGGGAAATSGGGDAVAIKNFDYLPSELTVKQNTTVTWTNDDAAPHTATASDGSFDTDTIMGPGKTGSVTLDKPGTFTYVCSFHAFMKGTVKVE